MAILAETNLDFYLCGLIPKGSVVDFHISSQNFPAVWTAKTSSLLWINKAANSCRKSSSARAAADEEEMEVKEGKREIVKNGGVVIQDGEGGDSGR